ncbi:hypothetical protein O3G_MSEX013670 [Manduca sexta]|uniref:Uncharacterized protein n=1 Tax=Manduca sexta TaxID=7130 RepID=A0A922CYU0_MANSE|nr:hypothetical protein O3G_MSEX013670 [Manduca sexta]KAG6463101.1 hypothetical protein O3G_MSEX013670 [Manduca sexta]KAG6463102.1 hypothetical protein O3G_MSEX013670 [Manduca sexta]KAG6463103.1 hypothetical protein O3G_MSEX013670 [Manduca sexta]
MSHGVAKSAKNGSDAHAPESSRDGSESPPPPPDGGWGWMVVFASFMIHIVSEYSYTYKVSLLSKPIYISQFRFLYSIYSDFFTK